MVWFSNNSQRKNAPFTRDELQNHLEKNNIETRPIMGGNMDANQG